MTNLNPNTIIESTLLARFRLWRRFGISLAIWRQGELGADPYKARWCFAWRPGMGVVRLESRWFDGKPGGKPDFHFVAW